MSTTKDILSVNKRVSLSCLSDSNFFIFAAELMGIFLVALAQQV